jgi:hypothetical protein
LSQEYVKALNGTKKALSDVLDVSEDFITTDFVTSADNLELIEKAAKGDADAIDELGMALAENIALMNISKVDTNQWFTEEDK